MEVPKEPPKDLARPSDFLNPATAPAIPKLVAPPITTPNAESSPDATMSDEENFGVKVVDQVVLEKEIATKADQAILEGANEDDQRRLEKSIIEKAKLTRMLGVAEERSQRPTTVGNEKESLLKHIEDLKEKIMQLSDDITDIKARMLQRRGDAKALENAKAAADQRLPNESEREFLIRTGVITPFDNIPGMGRSGPADQSSVAPISAKNLRRPGFEVNKVNKAGRPSKAKVPEPIKEALGSSSDLSSIPSESEDEGPRASTKRRKVTRDSDDEYMPEAKGKAARNKAASNVGAPSSEEITDESEDEFVISDVSESKKRKVSDGTHKARLDDGDEKMYQKRLREWTASRQKAREDVQGMDVDDDREEWNKPHPTIPDEEFGDGYRLPGDIHASLFAYQKVAVKWFWELHGQNAGGILGDEMGTGKTIQMISFLAGLHYSGMLDKPVIVVAPGAVLSQWASEFHTWWPAMRVAILHKSGSGMLHAKNGDIDSDEEDEEDEEDSEVSPKSTKKGQFAAKKIVDRVFKHGHVLITTYEGLATYSTLLAEKEWGYAVLDEGHKIRNPDSRVTINCKQLKTHHRVILSGTPIQNNLTELWSLFDFVFPGRLGTLPVFRQQFEVPIRIGGYKNAQNIQVQTATSCASVLRELIGPYLLRRMKADVAKDLPMKEEKVVFCKLTKGQVSAYQDYIKSREVADIIQGKLDVLAGISVLRKICCHPDLVDREYLQAKEDYDYGNGKLSGKMEVMKKMLVHWKEQGHRVLLFSQGTQVLDILEKNIKGYDGFKYSRMDGKTPIHQRQQLVDEFNDDPTIDVFLLTTRVGGLGLNLTGADRVIIFDPDWNPSTDMQARERSWRIGQTKPVSIYRLVAAGTIEEKMYNRQLYKQHLSQKVLNNPEQRRFFVAEGLKDLFSYSLSASGTSTGALFKGAETVYSNEDSALKKIAGVTDVAAHTADKDKNPKHDEGERKFVEEIFATSSNVHSSLEHDQAVAATTSHKPGSAGAWADKVASDAAKKLEESIRATNVALAPIGTVTWTGKSGTAGRATAKGLLNGLRGGRVGGGEGKRGKKEPSMREGMRALFNKNRGKVTTTMIKRWCSERGIDKRDEKKALEMKAILKDMATLDKETHVWKLKG